MEQPPQNDIVTEPQKADTQVNLLSQQAKMNVIGTIFGPIGKIVKIGDAIVLFLDDPDRIPQELQDIVAGVNQSILEGKLLFDGNREPHVVDASLTDGAKRALDHTLLTRSDCQLGVRFESDTVDAIFASLD